MASLLDVFAIGFKGIGLKEFEEHIKNLNQELNITENKIKELEGNQDELNKTAEKSTDIQEENAESVKETGEEIEKAKEKVQDLKEEINNLNNSTPGKILELKKNFSQLTSNIAQIVALGVAVKQSMQFYKQAEQLDFLAQKTNIAVDSLQRLGVATQRYGGTTEGTASTVEQFTTKEFKEKALKVGVSVSKDNPEQTLENIAAKMEKLNSDAKKWELAKSLGLDEGTTRLLIQGVERYREELKRANKYKLYTKEDIERMKDFRQVQQDIRSNVQSIQSIIYKMLLPAIMAVTQKIKLITDWFREHETATKMITVIIGVAMALSALKLATDLWAGALKLLKIQIMGMPIGWAIALISLLVFAIQDLFVFLQGGDSLIGKLWESWGYDLEEIRAGFEIWGERIERWWNNFLSIFNKDIEWENATKDIDILKPLTPEEQKKWEEFNRKKKEQEDLKILDSIFLGKQTINAYNNNQLNAVPGRAISIANQTISRNENNNGIEKRINDSKINNNKTTTVNIGTINTQAANAQELARDISTVAQMDNGFVA